MKLIRFAILAVLSLVLVYTSLAEDISVSASIDKRIASVGDVVILTIFVQGSQAVSNPALPGIDGFQTGYLGPIRRTSIINSRSSVSIAHRYTLLAERTGQFTIPSVEVKYKGKTYRTNPVSIRVISGPQKSSGSQQSSGFQQSKVTKQEDLKKYVYFSVSMDNETAYINEGIPLLLRLHVRSGIDVKLNQYPKFASTGFSVLPFEQPMERRANIEGFLFRIIDFSTTVYPVRSGELSLGPAELTCNLLVKRESRTSFFTQQMKYPLTVVSEPYKITVKPLPSTGQPESFSGAVGQYDLNVEVKPTKLKVGEPITLTMIVQGRGNIDIVNMPKLIDLTQFKAYDPQISVSKKDNSGRKTFEQVLIPTSDSIKAIPEIQFSYFDPKAEQYKTHTRGPIPIQVEPSDDAEPLQILEIAEGKAVKRGILGRDIVSIKDDAGSIKSSDGYLYTNKGFLVLQLIPLLGFAAVLIYQKRRDRFATDRTYARQYHAPRKAKKGLAQAQELMASDQPQEFCSAIFKTVQEYLGNRFDLPSVGITIEVVDNLRSRGIPEEILEKLSSFFYACDRLRFAQSDMSENEMKVIMDLATESIERLEDTKTSGIIH